jgi:predicted DNA-binding ribbon-helix-helix protein
MPAGVVPRDGAKREGLVKGSVTIVGHRTSLSLEPVFWVALRATAVSRGMPLNAVVTEIDEARTTNLSSAVRVWLYEQAQAKLAVSKAGGA